jgi:Flp pilus assembly CpaE family ATPase
VNLCVLSAAPESSSSGFATSLAAILGILARWPTLLVDLGNKPQQTRNALGIHDARGTEALVDQYIRANDLTADGMRQQIVSYVISTETNLAGRGFDCLAGPVKYTPQYEDRLAAQRGVEFAELLLNRLAELAYDHVVVDIGNRLWPKEWPESDS